LFQPLSSRISLRLRARRACTADRTATPTESGLSKRKGERMGFDGCGSSSERSDVQSALGRKCAASSDTVL
jgi:hypothetical protein